VEHLDLEVVAGLVEGGVRRHRDDHLGLGDALNVACPVAHGLARHKDGLSAARGGGAAGVGPAVVHLDDHRHDLGLHLAHAREQVRVQRVGQREARICAICEHAELLAAVVDGAGDAALLDGLVREGRELVELLVDLVLRQAMRR